MPDDGSDYEQHEQKTPLPQRSLPRREVLGGLGAGLAASVAGCSGGGGKGKETTTGGGDTDTATKTELPDDAQDKDTLIWKNPHGNFEAQLNYNPWNPKTHGGNMAQAVLAARDPRIMKFVSENLGGPFKSWDFHQGDKVVFHLADLKWHNGKDYVAEDVALHYRLLKQVVGDKAGPWPYVDQVFAEDDKTLVFNLTTDAIWEVIRDPFFNNAVNTPASPRHMFQENYEELKDATTDSEKQKAKQKLMKKQINPKDVLGDGPPNGFTPWKPVEVTEQYIASELWDEHPWAEDINFNKVYGVNLNLMKSQGIQMIKSGDLDSTKLPLSPQIEKEFKDNPDISVRPAFKLQTTALLINNDHEILGKPKVRRGLAYMLDRKRLAKTIFPAKPAMKKYPVPYSRSFVDEFVGDIKDQLFSYEYNPEKGAKLFREAGLSKKGGKWRRPDGKPLDFQFVSPPAKALDKGSSAVSRQLKRQGIGHAFVDKPGSYMWSQGYPQAGYDLCVGPWVFGFHPIAGMQIAFNEQNPPAINMPEKISYPSEIGNLDSKEKTVNPTDLISKMPTMSEKQRSQAIKDLTWAYNSQVYSLGISQKHMHHTFRVDDWEVPPMDTPGMGQGHVSKYIAKRSLVQAKK